MTNPPACAHIVLVGNLEHAPEFCDQDAAPGEEYCLSHLYDEDDWDELLGDMDRDDRWEVAR